MTREPTSPNDVEKPFVWVWSTTAKRWVLYVEASELDLLKASGRAAIDAGEEIIKTLRAERDEALTALSAASVPEAASTEARFESASLHQTDEAAS